MFRMTEKLICHPERSEGSKEKEENSINIGDGMRWGLQAE